MQEHKFTRFLQGKEAYNSELTVVFLGGLIVGFGGVDFVLDGAEADSFALDVDSGTSASHYRLAD